MSDEEEGMGADQPRPSVATGYPEQGASLSGSAMVYARMMHHGQERKYTGEPYVSHLGEVAGIVASVAPADMAQTMISVAWLHDVIEDCGVMESALLEHFGPVVTAGVVALSGLETGNRAERKAAARVRLAAAPGWVQTIKCADLISNASSIVRHDPKFSSVYLAEKKAMLDAMTAADEDLHMIAMATWDSASRTLTKSA